MGEPFLTTARARLRSARQIAPADPESAFILTYDSARTVAAGLLAQCGLRPTTQGGHVAVSEAARSLFGEQFEFLDQMRRLRHQLKYPRGVGAVEVQAAVMEKALAYADGLADTAEQALPKLRIWRPAAP